MVVEGFEIVTLHTISPHDIARQASQSSVKTQRAHGSHTVQPRERYASRRFQRTPSSGQHTRLNVGRKSDRGQLQGSEV